MKEIYKLVVPSNKLTNNFTVLVTVGLGLDMASSQQLDHTALMYIINYCIICIQYSNLFLFKGNQFLQVFSLLPSSVPYPLTAIYTEDIWHLCQCHCVAFPLHTITVLLFAAYTSCSGTLVSLNILTVDKNVRVNK
jgi:hypothetical protein